jgi:hypothetical protein
MVAALLLLGSVGVMAQPAPPKATLPAPAVQPTPAPSAEGAGATGEKKKAGRIVEEPGKGKIIVLDEEKIEGRIQKPEVFYILQRSNLNYKSLELQRSFVPEIVDSVKKQPF